MIQEMELPAHFRPPCAFRHLRHALPFDPVFLMAEVDNHSNAGGEEEGGGAGGEGLYVSSG